MAQFFGLSTSVPFPTFWTMAYQIAIFFVLEDTWHYFSHRALHWGPLYKAIHKIHHQYSAPFGMAAEYASPIEVMILGFGTVGCPILWCAVTGDLHIFTMYVWIVLRLFQAIDAHSGYEFPWSLHHFLPFWAGADHHDLHHEKFVGNYSSSFRWWDYLLDTEYSPEAIKRRRENKAGGDARKDQWYSSRNYWRPPRSCFLFIFILICPPLHHPFLWVHGWLIPEFDIEQPCLYILNHLPDVQQAFGPVEGKAEVSILLPLDYGYGVVPCINLSNNIA